jgi:beta-glucosidase
MTTFHFPKGFLWGTATASHQVEGNNTNNNWWLWEQQAGRILNGQKSGLACDWWGGRWKEDMDRARETGQNAHRMSVEWSRIQPAPDRWDEEALDRYRAILRGMIERGIMPMVTLHHFTNPIWLEERGGWENAETPALFEKFVRKTVEALKEYVTLWTTINEPNVYAYSGFVNGAFPPGKKSIGIAFHVMINMVKGHARAYHAIHEIQKEARVGMAINYRSFHPAPGSPLNKIPAGLQARLFNDLFPRAATDGRVDFVYKLTRVPEAAHTQDFLGINYYSRDYVHFDLSRPGEVFGRAAYRKDALISPMGFIANEPDGFFEALKWGLRFNVPMIVTENGVEDHTDELRPRYTVEHIHQLWRAVNFNWPIKGYYHWSLVDNFEWERGWTQRFGLWGLDPETQARIRRKSVDLYAEICKENGITSAMVQKYAPDAFEKMFPA